MKKWILPGIFMSAILLNAFLWIQLDTFFDVHLVIQLILLYLAYDRKYINSEEGE